MEILFAAHASKSLIERITAVAVPISIILGLSANILAFVDLMPAQWKTPLLVLSVALLVVAFYAMLRAVPRRTMNLRRIGHNEVLRKGEINCEPVDIDVPGDPGIQVFEKWGAEEVDIDVPGDRGIQVFEKWNAEEIEQALLKACKQKGQTTVRILQTWFPDLESFTPTLQDLTTDYGKKFKFNVLLLKASRKPQGTELLDLLDYRIKLRNDVTRAQALAKITLSKKLFLELEWADSSAELRQSEVMTDRVEVREYDYLPFGPFYQIGDQVMFVGFYPCDRSSINAPMLKLTNSRAPEWRFFDNNFDTGWQNSKPVDGKQIIGKS